MFFINLILFLFLSNCQANVDYYNVGTTLFSKRDANKRCWSEMDKDLLIARRIMQDVLPQPSLVDFTDSEAIPTLLTFIRTCFTLVRHGSSGVTQQHLLMGLADAIGGYQKAVLLPVTRQVYYAGLLSYTDGQSMHDLHEDIKTFLKTTGVGWKSGGSNVIRPQLTITPLEVNSAGDNTACDQLVLEKGTIDARKKREDPLKPAGQDKILNDPEIGIPTHQQPIIDEETVTKIPLPFLDDDDHPKAIAIPWKDKSVLSLSSNDSAYIIPKYYTVAVKCIAAKSNSKNDIIRFNTALYNWLTKKVVLRLNDDTWYIGFGGVLRVLESMKVFGINYGDIDKDQKRDDRYIYKDSVEIGKHPYVFSEGSWSKRGQQYLREAVDVLKGNASGKSHLVLLVTFFIMIVMIAGVCLVCSYWSGARDPKRMLSNFSKRCRSAISTMSNKNQNSENARPSDPNDTNSKDRKRSFKNKLSKTPPKLRDSWDKLSRSNSELFQPKLLASGEGWKEIDCLKAVNQNSRSYAPERILMSLPSSTSHEDDESVTEFEGSDSLKSTPVSKR